MQVAIVAFAAGIGLCLPTALILALNGASIGAVAGLFHAAGQAPKFWGLILPHGLLELTAVCVAGAAGLRLGWTIIDPGDRPRGVALAEEARQAMVIVLGLVVVFAAAGVIEGFVTGSDPAHVRAGRHRRGRRGRLPPVLLVRPRANGGDTGSRPSASPGRAAEGGRQA